jgi:hypothetical protein
MTAGAGSRIRSLILLVSGRVFSLFECLAPVPTIPEGQKKLMSFVLFLLQ